MKFKGIDIYVPLLQTGGMEVRAMKKLILAKFHGSTDGDGNFCVNPSDYETIQEFKDAIAEFNALKKRILDGEYSK